MEYYVADTADVSEAEFREIAAAKFAEVEARDSVKLREPFVERWVRAGKPPCWIALASTA